MNQVNIESSKLPVFHNRVLWVDVLKMLGMWGIYVSHFMESGGRIYHFTFTFLAELFFLMSGFFVTWDKDEKILPFIWKKFRHIMIPYFCFSFLYEFIAVLSNGIGLGRLYEDSKLIFLGIRTTLPAPALWFLPCLFVITVLYRIAMQICCKNKYIVFIAAFVIACIYPYQSPSWFWNLDSALKFMVFFALGPVIFPFINKISFGQTCVNWALKRKIITIIVTACCFAFAILIYFTNIDIIWQYFPVQLPGILYRLYRIIAAAVIIVPFIQLALLLQKIPLISKIGKRSLILCGTETTTKVLLASFLSVFGITVQLTSTLATVLYAMLCLIVSYLLFVPFFQKYMPWMLGYWKSKDKNQKNITDIKSEESAEAEKKTMSSH